MNKEEIQKLYKAFVLPESREPRNFSQVPLSGNSIEAYNPMCGDKYRLKITSEDGSIQAVQFSGHGCALSKASTSALIRSIEGLPISRAQAVVREFILHFDSQDQPADAEPENLLATLIALRDFGGRRDCITLSWKALEASNEFRND